MTNVAAAEALIASAIAAGFHALSCLVGTGADQYAAADACPTCRADLEASWASEQLGELQAERAMWNHLETNEEHREEMEWDDRRFAEVA